MDRKNRLLRATLVLALLVLAAIVTGVAESAAKTAIPRQLTGRWERSGWVLTVRSNGTGGFAQGLGAGDLEFSRVAAHRLAIRGGPPCWSSTGIYHWKVANRKLTLSKIDDPCKGRTWLPGTWRRSS